MRLLLPLYFFLFTFPNPFLAAQNNTIDSIRKEVNAWFPVKDRTELLLDLAYEYIKIGQPEITDSICLAIIQKNQSEKGYNHQANAYLLMASGATKNKLASQPFHKADSLYDISKHFFQLSKDSVGYVKATLRQIQLNQKNLLLPITRDKLYDLLNYEAALTGKPAGLKVAIYKNLFDSYEHSIPDSANWYWSKYIQTIDENLDEN